MFLCELWLKSCVFWLIIHIKKWSMQRPNAPYIQFRGVMKVNFSLWPLELLSRHCMAFSALINLVKKISMGGQAGTNQK